MDKQELKSKIMKGFTIALPILLVAVLAFLVVIAMDMKDDNSVPVMGDGGESTTTTTQGNGGEQRPDDGENGDVKDPDVHEPTPDPSSEGLSFSSNGDGTCVLDGIGECTDTFIIVPAESPEGDSVVEIADNAFKNSNAIKGIELPSSITRIGAYAFYGSTLREIVIPATVNEIGNYAFSGCKSLTEIAVNERNAVYTSISGVLYSKDGSTLITYPAGKSDNFVNISRDVTSIANMAFYRCTNIKKVNYHGTSKEWKYVEIGAGNEIIDEAFIYCAGDSGK